MSYTQNLDESNWPFDVPADTAAFTTRYVLDGSRPVIEVYHDHDGDWQFMCGATNAAEDGRLVGLGEMVSLDPTLVQLADLPAGWCAYRESPEHPWSREMYEGSDGEGEG